jgi:transcriptional regulator with XRE-family HTH domain
MALRRERIVERLAELRERHSLSQEDAARKVGVTHRQWQRWESGESTPYPRNLDKVASAFRVPVSTFFDEDPIVLSDDDQLDRIEAMLERITQALGLDGDGEPGEALLRLLRGAAPPPAKPRGGTATGEPAP